MSKKVADQGWYSSFFDVVAKAPRRLLLVDYEGTLAPAPAGPGCLAPYPGVPYQLQSIMEDRRTRLFVISERPAQDVHLALGLRPGPDIWGDNGLEWRRRDGHCDHADVKIPAEVLEALARSEITLCHQGLGKFVEVHVAGISVHWKGLSNIDDLLDIRAKVYQVFRSMAFQHASLRFIEYQGGAELRFCGTFKADALRRLLADTPPEIPIAYVGDDRSDAEAFKILNRRRLTVIVRALPRASEALRLRPPGELMWFLESWLKATHEGPRELRQDDVQPPAV